MSLFHILLAAVVSDGSSLVHPDRLLAKIRPGTAAQTTSALHQQHGVTVLHDLPQIGWQVLLCPPGQRDGVRGSYRRSDAFERVDLDRARPAAAHDPNDPYWPMWHMQTIRADDAWDVERGDASVRIAIMDTGIQEDHPDLAANIWTNPGEVPGNGVDDDGNGYIDDVFGYDFAYGDSDPDDVHGHGTACAGLAAAVQDNAEGVTGVAPNCQLVAVKAALDTGYFYDSANVPALVYCADMNFDVVSMSFYSDEVTPAERDAIRYCFRNGTLPVAAAGNSDSVIPYYPAAYEWTLSVAATDGNDNRTWFSNWGSWVDVAAPGLSLRTTTKGSGYTTSFAGTSGSCPHVAGLAGLLISANPSASVRKIRAAIEDTATSTFQDPIGEYTNYGLIDARAAVDRIQDLTSGSKAPRMLFAGPVAGGAGAPTGSSTDTPPITIYGVGLEQPNSVRVLKDGVVLPLLKQRRNWVLADSAPDQGGQLVATPGLVELEVNGMIIDSFVFDDEPGWVYTPSDACKVGDNVVTGGFHELYRNDAHVLTATERSDGVIRVRFIVRKMRRNVDQLDFEFTRGYQDVSGVETWSIYNWSTGSYPYGSFHTLATTAVGGTDTDTITASISADATDYIDDDRTMYFEVTTTGAGASALLSADSLRVIAR